MIKIKGRAGEVPEVSCIHVNVVRVDWHALLILENSSSAPAAARPGGAPPPGSCKHEPIPPPFLHPILSRACLESSISSYVERSKTKERAAAGAGPSVLAGRWAWALATADCALGRGPECVPATARMYQPHLRPCDCGPRARVLVLVLSQFQNFAANFRNDT